MSMDLLGAVGCYISDLAVLTDPWGEVFHVGIISRICFLVMRKKEKERERENEQTKSGQRKMQLAYIKFLFLISELADTLPAAFLTLLTA